MRKMKRFFILLALPAMLIAAAGNAIAQETPPLVYDVEFTGSEYPLPVLPEFSELPAVEPLTDPFMWSDGSGRDTTFASWVHRRAEIKAEIENYEIGFKPVKPDTIEATYEEGVLTVLVIENGDSLTLTSNIVLPEGEGPFPAIIGMGGGTGSLPSDIFSSRDIAQVPFNFGQVMAHTQTRGSEPINELYPDQTSMGAYCAWPWGVSRLIDGLELVSDVLPIDLEHLAVSGCSFAGKMALFAGAFDERIALTIAQESGGGGAPAWRVSETLGDVEKLGSTNSAWFLQSMFRFSGSNVPKLPHDHHELMAMCAPRALLVLGNPDYVWLAEEAAYVSSQATRRVYETFGIADRFGYSAISGHSHCALPASEYPFVEAFVEKFLLGNMEANTDIMSHPYEFVDHERWTEWWGSDTAYFPAIDTSGTVTLTLEAECGTVGSNWRIMEDGTASNGGYVTVQPGTQSLEGAPSTAEGLITIPFSVDTMATFNVFARLKCPSADDDSFWIQMDDGAFQMYNGLGTSGWDWIKLSNYTLDKGDHTMTIGYREDGAQMDKISISTYPYAPGEMGADAANACETEFYTEPVGLLNSEMPGGISTVHNYPNPFCGKTMIEFALQDASPVSLKVFSMAGQEIAELAGQDFGMGTHQVEFMPDRLPPGIYLYTLKTDEYVVSRKMVLERL